MERQTLRRPISLVTNMKIPEDIQKRLDAFLVKYPVPDAIAEMEIRNIVFDSSRTNQQELNLINTPEPEKELTIWCNIYEHASKFYIFTYDSIEEANAHARKQIRTALIKRTLKFHPGEGLENNHV